MRLERNNEDSDSVATVFCLPTSSICYIYVVLQ